MSRNLHYYVAVGKCYFGKATADFLEAQMLLAKARLAMPKENWTIVAY